MKEAYYFSHDSNARHDPKITAMRSVYGPEGYGWYWMLVEMMRESEGYRLDMQGKYTWNAFASQLQTDSTRIAEFVHDCISEFELFESDGEYFWSASLNRRMELRDQKSEVRRKAAKARWDKEKKGSTAGGDNATGMHLHSNSTANAMQGKESKRNKSKGKENKEEEIGPSSSPDEPFYSEIGVVDAYNQIYKTFTMPSVWSMYIRELKKRGIADERIINCLWHAAESSDNGKPGVNYFKPVMERWIKEDIYTAEESRQRREGQGNAESKGRTQGIRSGSNPAASGSQSEYSKLDEQQQWKPRRTAAT